MRELFFETPLKTQSDNTHEFEWGVRTSLAISKLLGRDNCNNGEEENDLRELVLWRLSCSLTIHSCICKSIKMIEKGENARSAIFYKIHCYHQK